jgi:hypothetical protein
MIAGYKFKQTQKFEIKIIWMNHPWMSLVPSRCAAKLR